MSSSFETNQPNVAISIPQETPTGSQATTPNATPGRERSTSSGSWHPNASAGISQARTGKVFYHDGVVDSNHTGQGRRKSFSQGLPVTIRESTGMANRRSHLWFWIHNGAELLALVFAWAACITAFAGVLHTFANGQAHWDHGVINNVGVAWKGNNSKCESIGAGYVAMYAISFIFLNLALGAMVYRLITKSMTASAMKAELACYAISFFFMFIAVPIWSGCIAETESISQSSAKWTGYAYQIFALIGMFLGMGPLLAIYNNDSYQSLHNNFPTKY